MSSVSERRLHVERILNLGLDLQWNQVALLKAGAPAAYMKCVRNKTHSNNTHSVARILVNEILCHKLLADTITKNSHEPDVNCLYTN